MRRRIDRRDDNDREKANTGTGESRNKGSSRIFVGEIML